MGLDLSLGRLRSNRRGFLRLIGAAPIAGTTLVKEAAAKMGLASSLSALAQPRGGVPEPCPPKSTESYIKYLKDELSRLDGGQVDDDLANQARHEARTLDPDLAAMRSMSPAVAYAIQRERILARLVSSRKKWLYKHLAKETGKVFGVAM